MILNIGPDLLGSVNTPGHIAYRHPEYTKRLWWREFGRVSYIGGREYLRPTTISVEFDKPVTKLSDLTGQTEIIGKPQTSDYRSLLFRHERELEHEYFNRQRRAYYHNFVRTAANSLVSHATKRGATRQGDELFTKWSEGVDYKRKRSLASFTRYGARMASVKGIMWACVDVPRDEAGGMPYAYWVSPLDILDWETDGDGEIVWLKQFVAASTPRTWKDPIKPLWRFRIWSREGVETYETDAQGSGARVIPELSYAYQRPLERVPFVPLYSVRDEEYDFPDGTPLLGDLCKAANHVFNLGSLLSEIIYQQTFSQLFIPDKTVDRIQMGLQRAIGYDANNGGKPEYLSPDAGQAKVIMEAIASTIEQQRQALGVGRGRQEGSMQQASAEALELESEDKRSILADVAESCEEFERDLTDVFDLYRTAPPTKKTHIEYSREFNLRAFQAEIDEVLSFEKLGVSPEISLELVEQIIRRKFAGMEPRRLAELIESQKAEAEKRAAEREAMKAKMAEGGEDEDEGEGEGEDDAPPDDMPPGQRPPMNGAPQSP